MNPIGMPLLGLGTWDLRGEGCRRVIGEALSLGYRHIDTAQMYENELEVGRGLRDSDVPRERVFLTTKLWLDNLTGSRVAASTEASLKRLLTDYLDLLLIHWPSDKVPLSETLGAMERLRDAGKTRHIGVSNFPAALWEEALELAPVLTNQVELHPFLDQSRKTPAQVTLRWLVQRGVVAIPKASRRSHLEENLEVFDFEPGEGEMAALSGLGRGLRPVDPGWARDG